MKKCLANLCAYNKRIYFKGVESVLLVIDRMFFTYLTSLPMEIIGTF